MCVAACAKLGTTRPLLQRDVMQASRCGPKSKATLGPAVKNVFVPRWLKLKTVVPKNEKQRSNVSCGSLVPSQRGSFPVLLPLRQRDLSKARFRAKSHLDFDTTSPASFGSLARSAIFLCGAAESFACWASVAVQAHS